MDVQMPMLVLAAVQYGGYVSPLKLLAAVALFFAWLPLTTWVYKDAQEVRTNYMVWTNATLATGVIALAVLLLAPLFLIGLPIALIGLAAVSIAYITHRNSRVSDFEKVLTFDHFKGLFVNEQKKMDKATRGISFVTANGNEVPLPAAKTREALAHRISCEVFDDALWRRASDILFRPGPQQYSVTYFVDGMAMEQNPRPREDVDVFIHYLKHIADLDTEEHRKPQIGKFKVVKNEEAHAWEVQTAGSTAGEQLKMTLDQHYGAMRL